MSDNLMIAAVSLTGVVLGLLIVVGLPVVLSMRHAGKQRAFEHAERMKALELGRTLPGEEPEKESSPANKAVGIALWVPLGALGIAMIASVSPITAPGSSQAIWTAAGAIGVTGVICGTVLTLRLPSGTAPGVAQPPAHKAAYEDDELDVVSRRG